MAREDIEAYSIRVGGRVQGVGYRRFAPDMAQELGEAMDLLRQD